MLTLSLILLTSLFFMGLIGRTKSRFSGRQGPGLLQPLYDLIRLFRKGAVYSRTASLMFQLAPSVYLASALCAVLVMPYGAHAGVIRFDGDFIFFSYTLALGKFFMILAALDTGSSFEGMGANRETLYSMLVEPAFFALMAALATHTGHTSFHEIFSSLALNDPAGYALGVVAAYLFAQIAMIENSRLPVDDPKTHLELTMVHEVMALDHSGIDLGMIQYASAIKFAMYGALIANFFAPDDVYAGIAIFAAVQILFAITVGLLESFRARLRMRHNPQFIFSLASIAILIFLSVLTLAALQRPS